MQVKSCLKVVLESWDNKFLIYILGFQKSGVSAGLNRLWQKGYRISVKIWIFDNSFNKKGIVLVILVQGMIQLSGPPFLFFVGFAWWSYKYQNIMWYMFIYIFKSLACLALQKKIVQPNLTKTKNEFTKICNEPGINVCIFFICLWYLLWKFRDFNIMKSE